MFKRILNALFAFFFVACGSDKGDGNNESTPVEKATPPPITLDLDSRPEPATLNPEDVEMTFSQIIPLQQPAYNPDQSDVLNELAKTVTFEGTLPQGYVPTNIYAVYFDAINAFKSVVYTVSGRTITIEAILNPVGWYGTYSNTLQVALCEDEACTKPIGKNGYNLAYTVDLSSMFFEYQLVTGHPNFQHQRPLFSDAFFTDEIFSDGLERYTFLSVHNNPVEPILFHVFTPEGASYTLTSSNPDVVFNTNENLFSISLPVNEDQLQTKEYDITIAYENGQDRIDYNFTIYNEVTAPITDFNENGLTVINSFETLLLDGNNDERLYFIDHIISGYENQEITMAVTDEDCQSVLDFGHVDHLKPNKLTRLYFKKGRFSSIHLSNSEELSCSINFFANDVLVDSYSFTVDEINNSGFSETGNIISFDYFNGSVFSYDFQVFSNIDIFPTLPSWSFDVLPENNVEGIVISLNNGLFVEIIESNAWLDMDLLNINQAHSQEEFTIHVNPEFIQQMANNIAYQSHFEFSYSNQFLPSGYKSVTLIKTYPQIETLSTSTIDVANTPIIEIEGSHISGAMNFGLIPTNEEFTVENMIVLVSSADDFSETVSLNFTSIPEGEYHLFVYGAAEEDSHLAYQLNEPVVVTVQ